MSERRFPKIWLLVVPVVILGAILALGLVGALDLAKNDSASRESVSQETNMSETTSEPAELSVEHVIGVLGDIQVQPDIYRKYILIPDNLSDEQLIEMFRQLHKIEPETWYYLMDSDSQFDQMMSALPETRNNDYSNWPKEYVSKHYVARLQQEIRGDGEGKTWRTWVVSGWLKREHLEVDLDE